MFATETLKAINASIENKQKTPFRQHLGASAIGHPCSRYLWYLFRWAKNYRHEGRILRLFERGNLEEERFIKYLKEIGCQVWSVDENGKQFKVSDHMGHFGGSLDSVIRGLVECPQLNVLGEFKTHNDKSFARFKEQMLVEAKFEHYVQMQIYMGKMGLDKGLYMATNKNDDDLYLELIDFHVDVYTRYMDRAKLIIFAEEAPPKISNSPSWWQCTFCNFKDICHNDEVASKNCRTCAFSTPWPKAKWHCSQTMKGAVYRPDNFLLYHPDMIGGATLVDVDPDKNFIVLQDEATGQHFKHGPEFLTSEDLFRKIPF
jgi:hypothetical protein